MNKEQDKENQNDFLMFNKVKQLKEEIEKCKDRVKILGNNQVSDKIMKEFLIEKNNYDKLQAELKGYQEAHEELRHEAIKWIKDLQIETIDGTSDTIDWIKHFFNITEEDLK